MEFLFEAVEHLSLQNSFGTLKQEQVTLRVEVGVREDNSYGWFEMYDIATGGSDWYAEGGLWFDENKMLVDYDGVFSLPECICECLRNNGFDTSYITG